MKADNEIEVRDDEERLKTWLKLKNAPNFNKLPPKVQKNIELWIRSYEGDSEALIQLSLNLGISRNKP